MKNNRKMATVVLIILGVLLTVTAILAFGDSLMRDIDRARAEQIAEAEVYGLVPDAPAEGIGNTQATHTQSIACVGQRTSVIDIGCPDWNYNTAIYGWDGHLMEWWEFDLFSRIFYLEFYGSSDVLCEAGCDAILRLWETEEFGKSIGELLTATNAAGKYVYDVYAYVWDVRYDPDGLEWCRKLCMERFVKGPEWYATYFQKWNYPDWGEWSPIPCYEIDGIYFSVSRWEVLK